MSLVARSVTANRAGIDIGDEDEEAQVLWLGVSRSERPRDAQERGLMTTVGSHRSASSPDTAAGSRPDPRSAALAPSERSLRPAGALLPQAFEVRCADIHPGGCGTALRAERPGDVVALACEHGALAHGFTPVWYSAERLCRHRDSGDVAAGVNVQPRSARDGNNRAAQGRSGRRCRPPAVTLASPLP
jgi:hypothetical protein